MVLGKNVIVRIYDNGWKLYGCASSCSFTLSTSTIETSVTGSGLYATFMPQKHSWNGTLEGVVNLDASLNIYDLRQMQIAMTPIQIQFERVEGSGSYYTSTGTAIIVNSSDTGAYDGIATFSIEVQGTGALTVEYDREGIFDDTFDYTFG